MGAALGFWTLFVCLVGLNLCAAGVAAILHAWRKKMRRGARVMTATGVTAMLPGAIMIPAMLTEMAIGAEAPLAIIGAGVVLVITAALSTPGALIVARKLEQPGDDYRAFE